MIHTVHVEFLVSKSTNSLKFSIPRGRFIKNMVILRGVSPQVKDSDFLVFADPLPTRVERFSGMPILKLIFDSEELAKKALTRGVTFGHSHYRAEPYVDKRPAYCRKCKSINKNHTECHLRCGKCGESHITKECTGDKIVCVNCKDSGDAHDSFHCPKLLKKDAILFRRLVPQNRKRFSFK